MVDQCDATSGRRVPPQRRRPGLRIAEPRRDQPGDLPPHMLPAALVVRGPIFDREHEHGRLEGLASDASAQLLRRELHNAEKLVARVRGRLQGAQERERGS